MKPPLNHLILHDDTLADEFDAIIGYRTSHAGIVTAGEYVEADVFAGAGVTSGVTPGYTGAPGVTGDPRTTVSGSGVTAGWTQASSTNTSITFTSEADVIAFIGATGFGTVSGSSPSTEADPHIISDLDVEIFTAAVNDTQAVFYWNHDAVTYPSEVYWIKFQNIDWGTGTSATNKAGNLYINAPTGGGAIIQNCSFDNQLALDAGKLAPIVAVRGTTRLVECKATRMNHPIFIYKNGANAIVEVIDSLFDATVGSWSGGEAFFHNAVAGGSVLFRRCTFDLRTASTIWYGRNIAMTIDRVLWNSTDNANVQGFISTSTGYLQERWDSGLTMTDCEIYSGSGGVSPLGWNTAGSSRDVANFDISHCEFIASDTAVTSTTLTAQANATDTSITVASISGFAANDPIRITLNSGFHYSSVSGTPAGNTINLVSPIPSTANNGNAVTEHRLPMARLVALGTVAVPSATTCTGITFSWCRFSRPIAGVIAGCEAFEIWGGNDVLVEYCWVDKCGEDAYEFVQPYDNVVIHHCGGGEVSGSYVLGQMVDFYGGGLNWASSTNCEVHHIWGTCGGDAVIVDACTNIAIHDIDITNVVGSTPPFAQNPPASNVRLHSRSANGLNGVTVTIPLSAPGSSFAGKPCELTYESGLHNAGTVVWPEWNGSSFDTRGGNDGIVDSVL